MRTTDSLKPALMTPIDPGSVKGGVMPPGMTPIPTQQTPAPAPPAQPTPPPKE
jgi:hypothetical protein